MAKAKIWIDLDNSPHVPLFKPIMEELEKRGHEVVLTARDCFQVRALAEMHKLPYRLVGRHWGKNTVMKGLGLVYRALQLAPGVLRDKPDLALSHGSRSQMILCTMLQIPLVMMTDYEHAQGLPGCQPDWMIVPTSFPQEKIPLEKERVGRYEGLKEDVYVPNFVPQQGVLEQLGIEQRDLVVTLRPPATEAHYFKAESEELFEATMAWLGSVPEVRVILLPRNDRQAAFIKERWPELLARGKVVIPPQVLDGLNVIWHSDLVISGGGTMNREAAALAVPVYSIFRGEVAAVDRYLSDSGRLTLITGVQELTTSIALKKRNRPAAPERCSRPALGQIVDNLESILANGLPVAPHNPGAGQGVAAGSAPRSR